MNATEPKVADAFFTDLCPSMKEYYETAKKLSKQNKHYFIGQEHFLAAFLLDSNSVMRRYINQPRWNAKKKVNLLMQKAYPPHKSKCNWFEQAGFVVTPRMQDTWSAALEHTQFNDPSEIHEIQLLNEIFASCNYTIIDWMNSESIYNESAINIFLETENEAYRNMVESKGDLKEQPSPKPQEKLNVNPFNILTQLFKGKDKPLDAKDDYLNDEDDRNHTINYVDDFDMSHELGKLPKGEAPSVRAVDLAKLRKQDEEDLARLTGDSSSDGSYSSGSETGSYSSGSETGSYSSGSESGSYSEPAPVQSAYVEPEAPAYEPPPPPKKKEKKEEPRTINVGDQYVYTEDELLARGMPQEIFEGFFSLYDKFGPLPERIFFNKKKVYFEELIYKNLSHDEYKVVLEDLDSSIRAAVARSPFRSSADASASGQHSLFKPRAQEESSAAQKEEPAAPALEEQPPAYEEQPPAYEEQPQTLEEQIFKPVYEEQPPAYEEQPPAYEEQPPAYEEQPPAYEEQPQANEEPIFKPVYEEQPSAYEEQPPANEEQIFKPVYDEQPPAYEEQPPANEEQIFKPVYDEQPPAYEEQPLANEEQPPANEEQPPANEEQTSANEEQPPANEEQPPANEEQPPANEEQSFKPVYETTSYDSGESAASSPVEEKVSEPAEGDVSKSESVEKASEPESVKDAHARPAVFRPQTFAPIPFVEGSTPYSLYRQNKSSATINDILKDSETYFVKSLDAIQEGFRWSEMFDFSPVNVVRNVQKSSKNDAELLMSGTMDKKS